MAAAHTNEDADNNYEEVWAFVQTHADLLRALPDTPTSLDAACDLVASALRQDVATSTVTTEDVRDAFRRLWLAHTHPPRLSRLIVPPAASTVSPALDGAHDARQALVHDVAQFACMPQAGDAWNAAVACQAAASPVAALRARSCEDWARCGDLLGLQWVAARDAVHAPLDGQYFWKSCVAAAREGHFAVLGWLLEVAGSHLAALVCAAASGGHLDVVRYLVHRMTPQELADADKMGLCGEAARNGHLEVVQYLHTHGHTLGSWYDAAARYGQLHIVQWAYAHGYESDTTVPLAAQFGHLPILAWARTHPRLADAFTTDLVCAAAVCGGHVAVLQWLRAQGCPC